MSQFICKVCGEKEPCVLEMVNDQYGFRPVCCPVDNTSGIKPEWHEVTTDCSQLPKLTAEVFDRPDCPKWAKWAAVDKCQKAMWYEDKPKSFCGSFWNSKKGQIGEIPGKWDASDWRNSLIERPAKALPDWCKVGEWVWTKADRDVKYSKITTVYDDEISTEKMGRFTIDYILAGKVCPARLRPYNAEEMKSLVGKILTDKDGNMNIIEGWSVDVKKVRIDHLYYSAEILLGIFTINGSPCGVLEHLENGEWVE